MTTATTSRDPVLAASADRGRDGDRFAARRAEFNEKFAGALAVFGENVAAWQLGWSWEQTCEVRRLCEEHGVAFDPAHYAVVESGMVVGWVGGPEHARPRNAGGTAPVGVTRDGDVYGIPGRISSRATSASSGNDGSSS